MVIWDWIKAAPAKILTKFPETLVSLSHEEFLPSAGGR